MARFANAAEAGYFANEIDYALGVEPRLDCRDDFDALHERWRSGFVLSVPEPVADSARALLSELLDGEPETCAESNLDSVSPAASRFDHNETNADAPRPAPSQIKWRPVLLTLAAGSLVVWYGKQPPPQRQLPDPRNALRVSLRDAPGLRDSAWIQSPGGGVRRELVFPQDGGTARLREDHDGDGIFEREFAVTIGE